jgi:hypothetical protein
MKIYTVKWNLTSPWNDKGEGDFGTDGTAPIVFADLRNHARVAPGSYVQMESTENDVR